MSFPDFPVCARDLRQVAADGPLGCVGIARDDSLVDGLMCAISDHVLTRVLQRNRPLFGQPGDNGLMQGREYGISRNQRQNVVERHVRAFESGDVAESQSVCVERTSELPKVRLRRMLGGIAGKAHFEHGSRFLEVAHAIGRGEQMTRRSGKRLEHDLRRRHGHTRALAAAHGHQSHLVKRKQSLAHGRPADTEQLHQIPLGGQLIAGGVPPLLDHRLEPRRDVLVELATLNGLRCLWYTYHTTQA